MILAIDPGNIQSGYALIDRAFKPIMFGKVDNNEIFDILLGGGHSYKYCAIEMISHYGSGMAVGETVFDTCIWIGRFIQALQPKTPELIKRATVKAHICGSAKATDSNVSQALIDRFAKGTPNFGKGTKENNGFFYGFKADIWQAYALAVTMLDVQKGLYEL